MSEEPNQVEDAQPRRRLSPVAVVLVLLVLYPLSIGPFVWYKAHATGVVNGNDFWFYRPLFWLTEQFPATVPLLKWYFELFCR